MIKVIENGGVCSPEGFLAAGVTAGIKVSGKPDLALLVSRPAARAATSLTQNAFAAAPVLYCKEVVEAGGDVAAVVVNSGCANACTGPEGMVDCREMAAITARMLGLDSPEAVMVSSTGRIGTRLPMDLIEHGIDLAAASISNMGSIAAAEAIMTTDSISKSYAVELELRDKIITIGGMAKGAGMIAPNMKTVPHATMLSYITTDACVSRDALAGILEQAVDRSFNRVTVDGDTSTNDTVILLANGLAGNKEIALSSSEYHTFGEAVRMVAAELAKMMAIDGEGASHLVTVAIEGAASDEDAAVCAKTIANSLLCKTAWFGADPNWGRILDAAGYAGVPINTEKVNLWYDEVPIVQNGRDAGRSEEEQTAVLKRSKFTISLDLGVGTGESWMWTCDLSYEYVKINADYHT
jgi:glutamate N-acetyltransferase/amino-acid N-acetyltransferase